MSDGRHARARYGGPLSWVALPARRRHRRARRLTTVLLTGAALLGAGLAIAVWLSSGAGASRSLSTTVNTGQTPTAAATGRDVQVTWPASTLANGAPVDGYLIRRYTTGGIAQTVKAGCAGTVAGLTCTEIGVPPGTWRYTVEPRKGGNWHGTESGVSANVTVGSPTFTITSPTTVTTLPTTLSGTIANFLDGETLTFHLDDPAGPVLAGTVAGSATPRAVPVGGSAAVTVTIPGGTTDGLHTIYAVTAPSGENASADITVSTAAPTVTITFPANGATYGTAGWNAGCAPTGVCGVAQAFGSSSLTGIAVSVRDNTTGLCWNGSNFTTAACPNFIAASGTTTWQFPFAASALTDGRSYQVTARATDSAAHQSTDIASFTYDTTAPVVTLTRVNGATVSFPFFTNTSITTVGGACTTGDGAVSVTVTGTSTQSGTATCTAASWTRTLAPALSAAGPYSFTATQTDAASHTGSSGSRSVTIDVTAPAVTLTRVNGVVRTFPFLTNAAVTSVGGACTSGDSAVSVTVTGTSSQSGTVPCSSGSWTYATSPTISAAGTYSFTGTQTDAATNTGSSGAKSVTIDLTPPVVTLTRVNGTTVTFPLTTPPPVSSVGGSCTTADGPVSLTVTGASPQTGSATCTAGAWTATLSPSITTAGTSSFTATQTDAAGNTGSSGAKSVTVVTGPTMAITFPVNGTSYDDTFWNSDKPGCAKNLVCGTAAASIGTVTSVRVSIQIDPASGLCWNGNNFTTVACPNFITATGTTSWTLPLDRGKLTDGHTYTVTVQGTDSAGTNSTTSTFVFDKTSPTVSGIFAVNTTTNGVGQVKPGAQFRVYATATDATSPVGAVTTDIHNVTGIAGDTAVPMTLCTSGCTIRGLNYTHVSGLLTAGAATGNRNYTVTVADTTQNPNTVTSNNQAVNVNSTAVTASQFAINNVGTGINGLAETGDNITITYSEVISVPSLCNNGSFTNQPDTATATVSTQGVVTLVDGAAAADTGNVTAGDCTLNLGTMSLGTAAGADYISGGAGATFAFSGSTIAWNGSTRVLTITLGATTSSTGGGTLVTDTVNTTATYTPSGSLTDVAGNASTGTRNTGSTRQF